jgi:hypothetical protein
MAKEEQMKSKLRTLAFYSPNILVSSLFIATCKLYISKTTSLAQLQLLWLPLGAGVIQSWYRNNHFKKWTLYFDLYRWTDNPNHSATIDAVKDIL